MPDEYPTKRRYRRHRKRRSWTRQVVSALTLIIVIAGLGLVAYSLVLGEDALLPRAVTSASKGEELAASAPKDTTLKLTVPKMARVEDLPVYDSPWDDESALDASAGHLDSSGFPWQDEANVYISGHRMGFPGTKSFLVFYDLDVLEKGDEVFLTDSNGTKYAYKVFNTYVADPYDWGPTESISGKNVVTLQTCTLPDYTQRLIVQAELTETTPGAGSPPEETVPQEGAAPEAGLPQEQVAPGAILPEDGVPQEEVAPEAIPQEQIAPEAGLPQEQVAPGAISPQEGLAPVAAFPTSP
jgi:sortase A